MAKQAIKAKPKPVGPAEAPAFSAKDWAAYHPEKRNVATLTNNPRNAKTHPPGQIDQLAASIKLFGWTMPALVDETDMLLAGHARIMAALKLGIAEVPVIVAIGWTDQMKAAYVEADNRLSELGVWDEALRRREIAWLKDSGFEMKAIGWGDAPELKKFLELRADDGSDRGRLLELVNVTIKEPTHQVEEGQHFILSDRHHLLCASPISDWPMWAPLLKEGCLFAAYPGVFVPFSVKAAKHPMIMVQPDGYIAGHILDRYAEVHGKKSIKQVKQ